MNRERLGAELLLFLTAAIWGFAFVAQRAGMSHIGPFTFNAIRFAAGALLLAPMVILRGRRGGDPVYALRSGILAGTVLFAGASLQQAGLVYTSAGNAGFITGLYVVLVPVLGMLRGRRTPGGTWLGGLFSLGGMYLLTSTGSGRSVAGDLLVLSGALFWAIHIQVVSSVVRRAGALRIAVVQFSVCALLSLVSALIFESPDLEGIRGAALPLAYGGLVSVGIAYTLQVVAQKRAHPSHAAVIMSLEAVFAAIGGWMVLGEEMSLEGITGCALMLVAMMVSARAAGGHGETLRSGLY